MEKNKQSNKMILKLQSKKKNDLNLKINVYDVFILFSGFFNSNTYIYTDTPRDDEHNRVFKQPSYTNYKKHETILENCLRTIIFGN